MAPGKIVVGYSEKHDMPIEKIIYIIYRSMKIMTFFGSMKTMKWIEIRY